MRGMEGAAVGSSPRHRVALRSLWFTSGRIYVASPVKNTSLAPVTVEGLAADDGASPYLATKILLGDGLDAGEANTRTFASFTPWPGATNGVVVVFTPQRDCARLPTTAPQPGAFRVYVEVQLRLRVLGVPRKQ